ncbi:MAG: hypothetical protein ACOYOK_02030 [Pseudobdellovibrionaceae bacterium]
MFKAYNFANNRTLLKTWTLAFAILSSTSAAQAARNREDNQQPKYITQINIKLKSQNPDIIFAAPEKSQMANQKAPTQFNILQQNDQGYWLYSGPAEVTSSLSGRTLSLRLLKPVVSKPAQDSNVQTLLSKIDIVLNEGAYPVLQMIQDQDPNRVYFSDNPALGGNSNHDPEMTLQNLNNHHNANPEQFFAEGHRLFPEILSFRGLDFVISYDSKNKPTTNSTSIRYLQHQGIDGPMFQTTHLEDIDAMIPRKSYSILDRPIQKILRIQQSLHETQLQAAMQSIGEKFKKSVKLSNPSPSAEILPFNPSQKNKNTIRPDPSGSAQIILFPQNSNSCQLVFDP